MDATKEGRVVQVRGCAGWPAGDDAYAVESDQSPPQWLAESGRALAWTDRREERKEWRSYTGAAHALVEFQAAKEGA